MRVLHVGMPKTGTTSLQRALARAGLLGNADGDGRDWWWGLRVTGFSWNDDGLYRTEPDVTIPDGAVLSDESLCLADTPEMLSLVTAYNPDSILLTTRPFSVLCEARWGEAVKHGEKRSLPEWMAEVGFADPRACWETRMVRPDYTATVWQVDEVCACPGDLVAWFSERYGVSVPSDRYRDNTRLSPEASEALREWSKRTHADYDTLLAASNTLAAVDEPAARLMSHESVNALRVYDAMVDAAVRDRYLEELHPMNITVRPVNTARVDALLATLEGE